LLLVFYKLKKAYNKIQFYKSEVCQATKNLFTYLESSVGQKMMCKQEIEVSSKQVSANALAGKAQQKKYWWQYIATEANYPLPILPLPKSNANCILGVFNLLLVLGSFTFQICSFIITYLLLTVN
jgi:hypothetical protein